MPMSEDHGAEPEEPGVVQIEEYGSKFQSPQPRGRVGIGVEQLVTGLVRGDELAIFLITLLC